MQISSQEKDQKAYDLEIAATEYRSALEKCHRVEERSTYNPNIPDPSLFLARLQCRAAQNTLVMVQKHYERLEADASGQAVGTAPLSPPTDIDYFAFFESPPPTPVDGHAGTLQDGLPSPPTNDSIDNVTTPTPGQAPVVPSTPSRQGTQPRRAPTSPSPPRTAPTSSFQPHGTPSTPTQFNTTFNIASPQTPNRKKRHYSVVVGRRTGIFSSWNLAKPMVEGLGSRASFQGFDTYEDASSDYFEARTQGWVRVVRLPSDDENVFGPIETAEDV